MDDKPGEEECICIPYILNLPFAYSAGHLLSHFYKRLKEDGKLVANTCPKCGRLLFPPMIICGRCHLRAHDQFVDLTDKGTVLDYTVVTQPIQDPTTGKTREERYPHATILLDDGVSFTHYLEETDFSKLREGMRVKAIFKRKEERTGHMTDILYFRTIDE